MRSCRVYSGSFVVPFPIRSSISHYERGCFVRRTPRPRSGIIIPPVSAGGARLIRTRTGGGRECAKARGVKLSGSTGKTRTCSRCRRGRSASTSIAATARLLVQLQRRAGDEGLEPLPRRDQVEAAGCRWCPRLAREMTIEPGAWGTKCRAALESRGRPPHNALDDAEQVERAAR
jgi:hypothetical protein